MPLEKLLAPGRIGSLELKNRIIYSAMDLRSTDGAGHMTDAAVESLVVRARRGVGFIEIPGAYAWSQAGADYGKMISLDSDEFIAPMAEVARRIHQAGARCYIQLVARGTRNEGGIESTGPSAMRFGYEPCMTRELSVEEIQERADLFGKAALRARKAGIDAVEVHACTGKLISMFLSPYSNHRTDEYGGSTENRTRFLREVIARMKDYAGQDYPLICRLTVNDMLPGGIEIDEGVRIAKLIDPLVEAIQPSAGTQERIWNISPSYFLKPGYMIDDIAAVKNNVSNPVIAMGKLGDPDLAESVVENGIANFVTLGRPLMVDPDWIIKAQKGDKAHIRTCVGCVNCFTFNSRKEINPIRVACTVYPGLMQEEAYENPAPAAQPKKIAIIGGGLAGMEAAIMLSLRGHKVDLYEKIDRLGGQWIVASHAEYKHEFKTLIPYMRQRMAEAGVNVHYNRNMSAEDVIGLKPDAVVLATGAVPKHLPLVAPEGGPNVVQGNDVIMDRAEVGHRVVIVGGRYIGMEAAVKLAGKGKHVSVIDAVEIGMNTNPRLLGVYRNMMVEAGVHMYPNSPVLRFTKEGVDIAHLNSMLSLPCDTIVSAVGTRSVNELRQPLEAAGIPCYPIGDCKRIGDALYATRDGAAIGMEL